MTLIWPAIEQEMKEVWLGGIDGAKDSQLLADNNIRTLVCCNPPLPKWRYRGRGIEYMVFDSNAVTEGHVPLMEEAQKLVEVEKRLALSCPGAAEHSGSIRFAISRLSSDSVHDCPRFGL